MRRVLLSTAAILAATMAAAAIPTFRGEVVFDRGIERHDELEAVLRGWVDDSMHAAQRDAEALAETARRHGYPFPGAEREIAHEIVFESSEIVSVLREDYAYEGGANGSIWLVPVNWDRAAGALIPIQSVLGVPEANPGRYERVAGMLREAAADQLWSGSPGDWGEAIEAAVRPDPMYLSTFTFVPSTVPDRIGGIAWHFEPYAVAPGARGVLSVTIPQADLRPLVEPEWRILFAGEPAEALNARSAAPTDTRPRSGSAGRHM